MERQVENLRLFVEREKLRKKLQSWGNRGDVESYRKHKYLEFRKRQRSHCGGTDTHRGGTQRKTNFF